MRLIGPPGEFGIVRLRRDVDNDVEDHGLLEIEHDVPSNSEPSTDTEIVLFREDGTIDLSLIRPCGPKSADITVDWSLWEDVRRDLSAILPTLGVARVRSARAEAILALEPETVTVRVELDGQLLVGGGCGLSGLLLAPALAERLAEAGLA